MQLLATAKNSHSDVLPPTNSIFFKKHLLSGIFCANIDPFAMTERKISSLSIFGRDADNQRYCGFGASRC
jgi:hypothetical protein